MTRTVGDRMRWATAVAVAALAVTGCSALPGSVDNADNAGGAEQDQAQSPATTQVEEGPGTGAGAQVAVDATQRHPNGTTVRVTGVSTQGNQIGVTFEATNGFTEEVELNGASGVALLDAQGNEYNFTETPDNSTLRVSSGATLSGTLVFLGPLQTNAGPLELRLNVRPDEEFDIAEGFEGTATPGFVFSDLPTPLAG